MWSSHWFRAKAALARYNMLYYAKGSTDRDFEQARMYAFKWEVYSDLADIFEEIGR